ncbi:TIGR02206 family membrane protein [Aeromicrobium sp. CFBP 8757]|uniref:YwaF family protein n=1 Tax=Aeromicrobium sp. CFBP 8757 TaxID=2775288 RepID=UPI0018D96764|nr:TIGR02206 family membrane protein [Aeromicrobium sp. CFBP 8757]
MMLAADERFESYGSSHLTVLAIFVIGVAVAIVAGRRLAGGPHEQVVRRTFAIVLLCVTIPLQVLQLTPDEWNPQTSLPLQLCDLAWMVAAHALWTRHRVTSTITYLWGITLTTQGMLTPDLASDFPEPRFLMFWGMHVLIVWASFFLVVGLRIVPTWRTYRLTVVLTLAWAVAAYAFNVVAGTNYGYLNRLPRNASLLDHLGPWPLYVVLEIAIVAAVWALLTWPWTRPSSAGARRGGTDAAAGRRRA